VERLIFGPKSTLTGKDSPDFELKTVDGRTITRASLGGQVTLLTFGARHKKIRWQRQNSCFGR
jgi:hypothetical protein